MNCFKNCENYKEPVVKEDISAFILHSLLGTDCLNYKPKEHEWEVGDWAYHVPQRGMCKITQICEGNKAHIEQPNGESHAIELSHLRLPMNSDWVKEVDGVKYRAYEDEDKEHIIFRTREKTIGTDATLARSFCRLANIPIMPYELSQGKYEYPKEELK